MTSIAFDDLTRKGFLTNYPPFRYWRPDAIESFSTAKPLNVYVHVPYCAQRCEYCFYKVTEIGDSRKAEIDRYVSALCKEIERAAPRLHLDERPVETVYFGGGTPTILSRENLGRIFEALRGHLQIRDDAEITVEAEPVTLTESKARHLQSLGVNRISMGIQSFHDEVVARTGRADREEHAHRAIALAKATGATVNIDLMSGLAGETDETWGYSVERAIESEVHSLTVYKTQIYPNSSYFSELRRKSLVLPNDSDELRWALVAHERFERAGYLPVNFFTYTRDGRHMQRHATNSWRGGETYGFGVSAFGMLHGHTLQNLGEVEPYVAAVEAGELPLARGYRLNARERMTRDLALGMKLLRVDRKRIAHEYGFDVLFLIRPAIDSLVEDGLLEVSPDALSLTRRGFLWGDYVGHRLIAALEAAGRPVVAGGEPEGSPRDA